ncbi:MAG: ABC transporter permease [Actinobacteria bacterium]|nr:ABC transporter permease [Actinomycetota bacterium]
MNIKRRTGALLMTPLTVILVMLILVPAGIFFLYSFYEFKLYEAQPAFILSNYSKVFSDPTYRTFASNTIQISVPVTILTVTAGFALAYYIVGCRSRKRTVLIALVVVSMLASYLARIYALRTLFGEHGIIGGIIEELGIGHGAPGFLLFSRSAVIIGQTYFLLPFATLVLFAGLSGIPDDLRAAGRDLGGGPAHVFRKVTLPLAGPAVLAAIVFVFFLSAGDYLTPSLLGDPNSVTIGSAIQEQLKVTGNYPLGAALSFVMVAAFALVYLIVRVAMRVTGLLPAKAGRA